MIAALRIIKDERKPWIKRISGVFPPKTSSELIFCGGTMIVDIKQCEHKRGVDWKKLSGATMAHEWLLPEGIIPPQDSGIIDFKPKRLPQKLLANIAAEALRRADIRPSELKLGLCLDEETEWFTEFAVDHAKGICLVTKEREEEKCEYYLEKYGAALVVSSDGSILSDCPVIIAPTAHSIGIKNAEHKVMFSPVKTGSALAVQKALPHVDEVFSRFSELYGDVRLLSALYELDGREVFASLIAEQAGTNLGVLSLDAIAGMVKHIVREGRG